MVSLKASESEPHCSLPAKVPDPAGILIICDDDSATERLKTVLLEAGFSPECTNSITRGCEAAKSGRFRVIVSTPLLKDGSWKRLTDLAYHYDLGFEVVLWAHNFDFVDWTEALNQGAFDVLDAASEQPKAAETARRALWAAYLKSAGPDRRATSPQKVA
jgi:DNA-binding NtrC family response regulator